LVTVQFMRLAARLMLSGKNRRALPTDHYYVVFCQNGSPFFFGKPCLPTKTPEIRKIK
jgi:hypothetical protein